MVTAQSFELYAQDRSSSTCASVLPYVVSPFLAILGCTAAEIAPKMLDLSKVGVKRYFEERAYFDQLPSESLSQTSYVEARPAVEDYLAQFALTLLGNQTVLGEELENIIATNISSLYE